MFQFDLTSLRATYAIVEVTLGGRLKADVRETLVRVFQEKKARNPGYSLRAFSRQLNLSPASLSQMLNGKRPISAKTLQQVLKNADLDAADTERIYATLRKDSSSRQVLDMDAFHMLSDWYYFAILSLSETEGFKGEAKWIAERLNIPADLAQTAIERLIRLEMLKMTDDGTLRPTGNSFSSPDGVTDLMIQKRHKQHLRLAENSLANDSVSQRDFTSVTMAIDPRKLPLAKEMIRKFRDRLCKVLESESQTEVFVFCQQLFPMTKVSEAPGDKK